MEKEKLKKIIVAVVAVISIVGAVILYGQVAKGDVDYNEVTAVVTEAKEAVSVGSSNSKVRYSVKVEYNNKEYDLKNVKDIYSYREGSTVSVYESNGKLYSDLDGVKTSTPVSTLYFVFLFVALFTVPYSIILFTQKKKENVQ